MTTIIHKREALFLRSKDLSNKTIQRIIERYSFKFYEIKACKNCEYYEERLNTKGKHLDICDDCAAYKGSANLASPVVIDNKKYIKAPIGNPKDLLSILDHTEIDYEFKNHFPKTKVKRKIKFIGKLRKDQKQAVAAIFKHRRGVVKAPPRSGKTVLSSAFICKLGLKTLILASQREWLLGFKETFVGSKTQKPLTNCKESQIGFCKTLEDFKKYDVCLATVQTFYNKRGQRLLRKIRDMFPALVVDEIHTGAAPKYAVVLASLNCKYKIGLSGTPSRKDQRFVIMRNLIGPNVIDVKVERLRPKVALVRTSYSKQYKGMVPWARMVSSLEKDPQRLKLIAKWAIKDAKDGHMILIPFAQVTPILALTKAINRMAGKTIAMAFHGKLKKADRDLCIERARKYKIKILVGNTKLLSVGTNIPRASALYEQILSSNKEGAEQRFSRVLTPWDDKPTPLIRIFLDDLNVRRNCLRNEFFNVLRPKFNPIMSDKDYQALKSYLADKKAVESYTEF